MPQIIVDSINRADLDMRKELFQSIVLSGGTTLTKGECIVSLASLLAIPHCPSLRHRLWGPDAVRHQAAGAG